MSIFETHVSFVTQNFTRKWAGIFKGCSPCWSPCSGSLLTQCKLDYSSAIGIAELQILTLFKKNSVKNNLSHVRLRSVVLFFILFMPVCFPDVTLCSSSIKFTYCVCVCKRKCMCACVGCYLVGLSGCLGGRLLH